MLAEEKVKEAVGGSSSGGSKHIKVGAVEVLVDQGKESEIGEEGLGGKEELMVMDCDLGEEEVQKEDESSDKLLVKGKICSRCCQKGHAAANCSTVIYCDICDSHEHVNHRCHILKQPRPVAHAVGYALEGLGFYHIPHPPLLKGKKENRTALISCTGGQLTKEQMPAHLRKLFPVKWKWEPVELEGSTFTVLFPSRADLKRAIAFGGADVKETGMANVIRLQFEEWSEKEEGFLLPKI